MTWGFLMKYVKVALLLPAYMGSNHSLFLGIGYLTSMLKSEGHEVKVIDEDALYWIYKCKKYPQPLMQAEKRVIAELQNFMPDIICEMINTTNYNNALRMLGYIKNNFPQTYIVVGGPHISTSYDSFHRWHSDVYDAAIIGEGESSLTHLCYNIGFGINGTIPGVRISQNPDAYIARDLVEIDSLPFPDRNAFFEIYDTIEKKLAKSNYERVFYAKLPGFSSGFARVVASRGCYNSCKFCSPGQYWKNPRNGLPCRRVRSAKNVVEEIEVLLSENVRAIYFDDPTFPIKSNMKFFSEFEYLIKDRRLSFFWGAPICSNEVDTGLLDRLQKIGFTYTYFGLESYNIKHLNDFNKIQDIENCLTLIQECNKRGIHCDASYQVGLPNDDDDDIKRSIDWIFNKAIEKNVFFSISAIWPATELACEYNVLGDCYEPNFDKNMFQERTGLYYYEQGNEKLETFYSNCSGTYHFIPVEKALEIRSYIFQSGLRNRFEKEGL